MAKTAAANPSPSQFGAFLRKQRQVLKLRQHEFAQQVGVSQSYISLLEKGKARPPSKGVCDRIAEIIKHDPRQLWLMTRGADIPFPEIQDLVSTLGRAARPKDARDRMFEDEVARLLALAGYRVTTAQEARLEGGDLLARARLGPVEHKLLVVCLRRAVGKPLSAAELAAFQGQLEDLRARGLVDRILVVSSLPYTEDAADLSRRLKVDLCSFFELNDGLFNFKTYLQDLVTQWENRSAREGPLELHLRCAWGQGPALGLLDVWLEGRLAPGVGAERQLLLLAPAGAGKSLLLARWAYELAQRGRGGSDPLRTQGEGGQRVPVLFPLSEVLPGRDLRASLVEFLQRRYGLALHSVGAFDELNRAGRLLLLLDGLEAWGQAGRKGLRERMQQISDLAQGEARLLVAAATGIFTAAGQDAEFAVHGLGAPASPSAELSSRLVTQLVADLEDRPVFEVLHLLPLAEGTVRRALEARLGAAGAEVHRKLAGLEGYIEILAHPGWLSEALRLEERLGARGLEMDLEGRVAVLAQRGLDRGEAQSRMGPQERRHFLEALAARLDELDLPGLNYAEFFELLREVLGKRADTRMDLDAFDQDLRTSMLLARLDDGRFGFAHELFQRHFARKPSRGRRVRK